MSRPTSSFSNEDSIQTEPTMYTALVPAYIQQGLSKKYEMRPYQYQAIGRFVHRWQKQRPDDAALHLLYHMATGSGKTLVMAGLLLYLYEQGYRNFLFFVNSNNIIDKTRDNFLNEHSSKYLFADSILVGNKKIRIREVNNFQATNKDDLNIVFTTIQALHSRMNSPREEAISFEDLRGEKIVLISDEAHHINAETKKKNTITAEEKEALISWERTVFHILHANKNNVLLEFTATADWSLPQIRDKYRNKIIFDYPLKQFRREGYSKEVKVWQTSQAPLQRALQAMLLSQYRRKLFEKYGIAAKPVVLFKSKTIKDSQAFYQEFIDLVTKLNAAMLSDAALANIDGPLQQFFKYLRDNGVSLEGLAAELKEDFSPAKLISVNSKDDSEAKQIAVNTLEEERNPYRAIFAVDKLNEGWDVLNLFDIVRLYDTKEKQLHTSRTTVAEAQLIGRGARYFPFKTTDDQSLFTRKFDDAPDHELRICEVLYYHSAYDPAYIRELGQALVKTGIQAADDEKKIPANKGNRTTDNNRKVRVKKDPYKVFATAYSFKTRPQASVIQDLFDNKENIPGETRAYDIRLTDFGVPVIRKAMNNIPFFHFDNLLHHFPALTCASEFVTSQKFLGQVIVKIEGDASFPLQWKATKKLAACLSVLQQIAATLIAQ